ncbi:hypothetical protein L0Z72_00950 [candidate division KSB1 bacterium]|nr:hypothetical protein [candidate division KSB1 bacterium]
MLIKFRLKYYRNYIRYHFDRRTKIEIGIVVLILLLLTLRSPADIGYNFKWMHDENFLNNWRMIFLQLLPIFYLISEAFAFITLRISQEWQILGTLPFQRKSIANYFLIRQAIKISPFLFIGIIPFFLALSSDLSLRIFSAFITLGFLFLLQMLSFYQAFQIRNHNVRILLRIGRWFVFDGLIIAFLILFSQNLGSFLLKIDPALLLIVLIVWLLSLLFLFYIQRSFVIHDAESTSQKGKKSAARTNAANMFNTRNVTRATILRDVLFLWRENRSSIVLFIVSIAVSIIVSLAARGFNETVVSLISIEILFSLLWTKTVLSLFESDIHAFTFIRSLPISASTQWRARWLFIAAIISFPLVIPIVVIAIRFGLNFQFLILSMVMLVAIPGLMATLFCNSGFGLFPHINLTGLILMISLILIMLFWFFMPFGSLLILAVIFLWIRKSQRNFKYLELT